MLQVRIENNTQPQPPVEVGVQVGDVYPGYCCTGFDYVISTVWPALCMADTVSGVGACLNPDCTDWDGTPDDIHRGVSYWEIRDLAAAPPANR